MPRTDRRTMLVWAAAAPLAALGGSTMSPGATKAAPSRTRETVAYDTVSIDTIVEGSGPTIVLLPSHARDSEDFDAIAEGLADAGFRVLRPQPRGIGRSTGPMTGISLHDFARDIAEVIRRLGEGRAVVVGHAYGNWVARMTAVDFPDLVRGVVILAAAAKSYPPHLRAVVTRAGNTALPEADRLAALREGFFAAGHDPHIWLDGWHPEVSPAQRAAADAVKQSDWWSAGRAPLLDLQAEHDPFKPPASRQEMKAEFGDRITTDVIPDASHALVPEQPALVVAALVRWIKTLP